MIPGRRTGHSRPTMAVQFSLKADQAHVVPADEP